MNTMMKTIDAAVVGGVNVDIGGFSRAPLTARESNPGAVRLSLGGVGRNIAHNMALLGLRVSLLTALGGDPFAARIASSCKELGIDLSLALRVPEAQSSTYLFLAGPEGDMALAVSDMEIYRRLTPAVLAERMAALNRASALVLDTNLPAETIQYLCEHAEAPIFADPVSSAKADKLRPVLGRLHSLKPNRLEAELLSGVKIDDEHALNRAADTLLDTGLRRVYLSLGADGVLAADAQARLRLPAPKGRVVNTTGCGDAFMAALVWAQLHGEGLEGSARAGLRAAALTMAAEGTISPRLSAEALAEKNTDASTN